MRLLRDVAVLSLTLIATAGAASAADYSIALDGGYHALSAGRSADAVFEGPGGFTAGAFARVGLSDHFAVGLGARGFSKSGERAFVASSGGAAFRLGHPLEVRLIPIYALASWRFRPGRALRPYVGLGPGLTSYREESTVGGVTESESATKFSGHLAAGVEFGRRAVKVGVEGMFTTVPSTLGLAGVSQVYGEKDAGGFTVVGKLVFGR